MVHRITVIVIAVLGSFIATSALATPVYLNNTNISVVVGSGTAAGGNFHNTFSGGATIEKVIDAPSATASETHSQSTHIWFTADDAGGGLELLFDFGTEYDISTLHFWNYTGEGYDVDNVAFTFFNAANAQVGALSVSPALGSSPGILAQDISLAAPINVQFVTAFLTGSNKEVDFQNIGFTAEVSDPTDPPTQAVPGPGPLALFMLGLGLLASGWFASRHSRRSRK